MRYLSGAVSKQRGGIGGYSAVYTPLVMMSWGENSNPATPMQANERVYATYRAACLDLLGQDVPLDDGNGFAARVVLEVMAEVVAAVRASAAWAVDGSREALVGGACVTLMKAWFDEGHILPDPPRRTVGDDLAACVAHLADAQTALAAGEALALVVLRARLAADMACSLTLTRFDGTQIMATDGRVLDMRGNEISLG